MFHKHERSGTLFVETKVSNELKSKEILERVSSRPEHYAMSTGGVAEVPTVHSTSTFSVHQSKLTPWNA
jgi:hypothetical protein